MRRALILVSLIFVIFFSGCINQEKVPTGAGVIVKSFGTEGIPEVFSGDSVTFTLSVENVGEEDAENVKAVLFGLGTDWTGEKNVEKDLGFLSRSQSQYKIAGGVMDAQWEVKSPYDLKVDNTYTAGVRVKYSYKTTAVGNIKIYDYDYLKADPKLMEKATKESGVETFVVTKSPLSVSLSGLVRPIIYRQSGQQAVVTIQIENKGPGNVYETTIGDRKISVDEIKVAGSRCIGQTFPRDETLLRSGPKSITCKFDLPPVTEYTTIPIEVKLSYNYYLDSSASIKVLKVEAGGGVTPPTTPTTTPPTTGPCSKLDEGCSITGDCCSSYYIGATCYYNRACEEISDDMYKCTFSTCSLTSICGVNTLAVGKKCSSTGCSSGTIYTCDSSTHANCNPKSCGCKTYYCTYSTTWQWRPSYPSEVCGDTIDNDCDGPEDEGCP